jgi:hypothetical protein
MKCLWADRGVVFSGYRMENRLESDESYQEKELLMALDNAQILKFGSQITMASGGIMSIDK